MAHILLVEDELYSRRAMKAWLLTAGHYVSEAADGVEAFRVFEANRPDAVIADLQLPVVNGIELLQELHRRMPALPLIAITGKLDYFKLREQLGVKGFLMKPFDAEQLVQALEQALAPS